MGQGNSTPDPGNMSDAKTEEKLSAQPQDGKQPLPAPDVNAAQSTASQGPPQLKSAEQTQPPDASVPQMQAPLVPQGASDVQPCSLPPKIESPADATPEAPVTDSKSTVVPIQQAQLVSTQPPQTAQQQVAPSMVTKEVERYKQQISTLQTDCLRYKTEVNSKEEAMKDMNVKWGERESIWKTKEKELLEKINSLEKVNQEVSKSTETGCEGQANANAELNSKIQHLEQELQARTEERENFKNKLQAVKEKLAQAKPQEDVPSPAAVSVGVGEASVKVHDKKEGVEVSQRNACEGTGPSHANQEKSSDECQKENIALRKLVETLSEQLKEKMNLNSNQEKQNKHLLSQIVSLKEVVAITKDLLNIRNVEASQLQIEIDSMEGKIKAERERQNTMLSKMEEAVKINGVLKQEYEKQLRMFEELKLKYEEKVMLLKEENQKLQDALKISKSN